MTTSEVNELDAKAIIDFLRDADDEELKTISAVITGFKLAREREEKKGKKS